MSILNMIFFNISAVLVGFMYVTLCYILIFIAKILHWYIKKKQIKWKNKPDSKADKTQLPV